VNAEDPQAMVEGLRALAQKEPAERIRMGEAARRYAQTALSMDALGDRMELMLDSAVVDFRKHA
jgi:hypothetical protein